MLNAGRLATNIENGIRANQGLGSAPLPDLTAFCNTLATSIVNEVKEALVTVNVAITTGVPPNQTTENHQGTGGLT